MHHSRTIFRSISGALVLVMLAAPTLATGATRASEQQLPQLRGNSACAARGDGKANCAEGQPEDRGPPNGFPHSPGLDEARHHADCHAAFRTCDSPGG